MAEGSYPEDMKKGEKTKYRDIRGKIPSPKVIWNGF